MIDHRNIIQISRCWCIFCKKSESRPLIHQFLFCACLLAVYFQIFLEFNSVSQDQSKRPLQTLYRSPYKGKKKKSSWNNIIKALLWEVWLERNRTFLNPNSAGPKSYFTIADSNSLIILKQENFSEYLC